MSHRQNNFDFLRLFFASLVIISHSYAFVIDPTAEPHFAGVSFGGFAVDAFFAISGYLITISWLRSRSLGDFAVKRISRVYPGLIVCAAICLLVVLPLASPFGWKAVGSLDPLKTIVSVLAARLPRTLEVFPDQRMHFINVSLWTIKHELLCYCGVAVFGLLGIFSRRVFLAAIFGTSLIFSGMYAGSTELPRSAFEAFLGTPGAWCRLSAFFLAGSFYANFKDIIPFTKPLAALSAICVLACHFYPPASHVVFPVAFSYFVLWFAEKGWSKLNHVGKYGDFSYGTYLYGCPIQQLTIFYLGPLVVTPWLVTAISLPLAILAGAISWHFVEKPCLRIAHFRPIPAPAPTLV